MPNEYPDTVVEVIDDKMTFPPEVIRVASELARSRPWTGTLAERKEKFRQAAVDLAVALGIRPPELRFGRIDGSFSGASYYEPRHHRVVLSGRLSIITMFHEVGHALGFGERQATAFSVNLFKRCFPRQFARLIHRGHTLLRPQDVAMRKR
jgi:hypothetical protein